MDVDEPDLTILRAKVRSIDSELVGMLARRFRLVRKISRLKRRLKMEIVDPITERVVVDNFVASAAKAGMDIALAKQLASFVIESSVDIQTSSRRHQTSGDFLLKGLSEAILRAQEKRHKLVRLDIGEPRFRTPRAVIREASKCLRQSPTILYGSSAGLTELSNAIAARLNRRYGTKITSSNILITPGARFAIFAAIRSCVSSLEGVVVCHPAWPAYESCIAMVGARSLSVSTRLEDKWDIDLNAMDDLLKLKPKMLVLNSPNNPTGKLLSGDKFSELMRLAEKRRIIVLSDEVYASYSSSPAPSVLEYPDCEAIYVNSFSKEFSMTGWRIAYAVAHESTITRMRRIVETTLTSVPEFVQRGALAALKDTSGEADRARCKILSRVRNACTELSKGDLEFHVPDGGFYVFPRIKGRNMDSTRFVNYILKRHGVGVLPGTIFGEYESYLRLAITESEEAVKTGIKRILRAIDEWRRE